MTKHQRHKNRQLAAAIVSLYAAIEQDDKIEGLASSETIKGRNGTLEGMADDVEGLRSHLLFMMHACESLQREVQGKGRPEQDYRAIAQEILEMADQLGIRVSNARKVVSSSSAYSALEASIDISMVYGSMINVMKEREQLIREVEELRVLARLDSMPCVELNALYASSPAIPDER